VTERSEPVGATLFANRFAFDAKRWRIPPDDMKRTFRPSLAYRLAALGEQKADAMLTFRDSWEWDLAAGVLIAAEAGAKVTDRNGAPLVFNAPHPKTPGVLAASPKLHGALIARMAPT
ncbi:MAG: inositol monophosphatase family protein, partial [Pseudomonadota bacterium]